MFPAPWTVTVSWTESFIRPVVVSTSADISNLPTAPVNPVGASVGIGRTSIVSGTPSTTVGASDEPGDTVSTGGSISIVPTMLGKRSVRSSMTLYTSDSIVSLYSSCSVARTFQNPAKPGGS